jgi:hypothetical protein
VQTKVVSAVEIRHDKPLVILQHILVTLVHVRLVVQIINSQQTVVLEDVSVADQEVSLMEQHVFHVLLQIKQEIDQIIDALHVLKVLL